ncbi:MAG: PaaI family thioesterase, partial [Crocinitomicaceae bacterium]
MMDAALGVAALSLSSTKGKVVSTVDFHMSFLVPVKLDDILTATGEIIKAGNRIFFAEAIIVNQHGELISKGSGTFNAYPVEKIM